MKKKAQNQFEPGKQFSALPHQRGPVQQDSDWNGARRSGSLKRGLKRLFLIAMSVLLIAALLAGLLFYRSRQLAGGPGIFNALVVLTRPANGAILPLHGTLSVSGEATSRSGVKELQLIVNGQPWGARTFDVSLPAVQSSWKWTPSGEGTHEMFIRTIDGTGRVFESNHVRVVVAAKADARFPLQYSASEGDTVNSLAAGAGIDPQEILETNPGIDPEAPLPPGTPLTIPIHVPNAAPAAPESGAPAAPPVEPLPDPKGNPFAVIDAGLKLVSAEEQADSSSGFFFSDGKIIPAQLVDQLYLYVSVNGEEPWRRIPDEPMTFLSPEVGGFDISAYLNLAELEASPSPVSVDAEAWGWQGGTLIFLGSYHGMIGGGLRAWQPKNTTLKIVAYEALGMPEYVQEINLAGEDPTLTVEFDWSTSAPDVSYGRWQVSTEPFPDNPNLFPNGLVQQAVAKGSQGRFEINFNQYFQPENLWGKLSGGLEDMFGALGGEEAPLKTFWGGSPLTFYVQILPLKGNMLEVQPTGGPSNMVLVRYLPSGQTLAETGAPGGPVYQTQIVEFIPYRAADPAYESCTVLTQDFTIPGLNGPNVIPAGTGRCGCPGAPCGGGGSSCSWDDPGSWVSDCPAEGIDALASAASDLYEFGADLYNGAKKFVVDTLSSGLCDENFLGAAIPEDECKLLVEIGVNAGLAAMGLPPEIPDFEALFDEGLEYAVASLAAQITGFECDETCRALLKKAYQGASNPEQLYQEGLLYGASLAADELGVDCAAECQSVIQQGVQGKLNAGDLTEEALEALAKDIAQKLRDQQHECDADCETKIAEALKKGDSLGQAVASTASKPPEKPLWVPHPLAMEQPPIAKVEVFRRWESAPLDPALIAERCSGFTIDNSAVNMNYSMSLTGRVFEPRAIAVPLLEPGGSFRIPVVLHPAPWYLPQGFTDPLDPFLLGYADVGEEDGQQLGQVQQGLTEPKPFQSYWRVLYYGSNVDLKVFGPFMMDVIDGKMMSFPCFSEDSQTYNIPMP
jgi:hypothetical protein